MLRFFPSRCTGQPAICLASLAVLAVTAPGVARAQSPQKQAIILYQEAGVHYNMGQYDLAAAKYLAAIKADPSLPGPYRNLGLTYRAQGKCDLALPYFRKYVKMRPEGRHSDRVRQEIEYCAKKVGSTGEAPVGVSQIVLRCPVKGAQVHIDGELRGSTSAEGFPVQPGKHSVTVYRSGYKPWTGSVELSEGQVVALDVDLKPDPNATRVEPTPSPGPAPTGGVLKVMGLGRRMSVFVDGTLVELDQDSSVRVAAGKRTVRVEGPGAVPWSSTVTIKVGDTTTVMPVLELSETGRKLRRWGWIATGMAAAAGLAGGALGLLENRTYERIRDYDRAAGSRNDLNSLIDTRRTQALASNVLYGVAGALLGTGVALFLMAPDTEQGAQR